MRCRALQRSSQLKHPIPLLLLVLAGLHLPSQILITAQSVDAIPPRIIGCRDYPLHEHVNDPY
jgi:hypothetical protein